MKNMVVAMLLAIKAENDLKAYKIKRKIIIQANYVARMLRLATARDIICRAR